MQEHIKPGRKEEPNRRLITINGREIVNRFNFVKLHICFEGENEGYLKHLLYMKWSVYIPFQSVCGVLGDLNMGRKTHT